MCVMLAALRSGRPLLALRLPAGLGAVVLAAVLTLACSSTPRAPDIPVEELQPPPQYVTGLQQFLGTEDNNSTHFGKDTAGSAPRHGDAVWGYYSSGIDQEPWKSQLVAQETAAHQPAVWPPVPLSGPILNAPQFRDRALELYVSVEVLPTQDWAAYALSSLQQSAAGTGDAGRPCPYGQHCLQFTTGAGGLASPKEDLYIWRWRTGRVVFTVSALGAPGWPANQMAPLLEYYTTKTPTIRGVNQNQAAPPAPSPLQLPPTSPTTVSPHPTVGPA